MKLDLEKLYILQKLPLVATFTRDDGKAVTFRIARKKNGTFTIEEFKNGKALYVQAYSTSKQAERFVYLRERQLIYNHFKCSKVCKEV